MDVQNKNKLNDLETNSLPDIHWQEIKKHNNHNDCWIVIDHFVYDITQWIQKHPGGNVLTILAGKILLPCIIPITLKTQNI